ncbi:cytochrome C oxidase assembly protein [Erythrobacter sp. AP23]|nr:cytochrome C oxidase assembly protein [Erythrobacter sp. AP23]
MTPDEETEYKRRQKSRNLVLGGLLLFFAILFYVITIARM